MATTGSFSDWYAPTTATIASGAALSAAVNLDTTNLVAIQMPATWTTANLTFQASYDGTTFNDVYDSSGTELSVTAAASQYITLTPADFAGMKIIKIRSGTTGAPVNQGGDRTLQLVTRSL